MLQEAHRDQRGGEVPLTGYHENAARAAAWSEPLSPIQLRVWELALLEGEAVDAQDLVDGLEVGGAARGAVARAAGRHALRVGAGDEGTARVTRLGADAGLGEAVDRALGVIHRRVQGLEAVAVRAGRGTGAAD